MADFGVGPISTGRTATPSTYTANQPGNPSFPNSVTGRVAQEGLSRLRYSAGGNVATTSGANVPVVANKNGVLTINGAATTTTAALAAAFGLTTFSELTINVVNTNTGVTVAEAGGNIVLQQGDSVPLGPGISAANSPVTITTQAGDIVRVTGSGV